MEAQRTEGLSVSEVRAMRSSWSAHLKRRRSTTVQILASLGEAAPLEVSLAQSGSVLSSSGTLAIVDAAPSSQSQSDASSVKRPAKVVNPWLNDWSQHYVDTHQRPQNFIRRTDLSEYPRLRDLIVMKDKHIRQHATPPMYMKCELKTFDFTSLGCKFDVIVVDPPWEEYARRTAGINSGIETWTLDEIMKLPIEHIAELPCFVFLWVGSAEGLDQGRAVLAKWGFRRCEDICWVKTNQASTQASTPLLDKGSIVVRAKEHCLMGMRGNVRRNLDGHLIHSNVDTDVIITPEPPFGSLQKPKELYSVIEHFAQGLRRLELFGEDHNIRPGWVTLGKSISSTNFSAAAYTKMFSGGTLLPGNKDIEELRPKSPTRKEN